MSKPSSAFTCRRCGDCCRGQGGIMLTPEDIDRLCAHPEMTREMTREQFARSYLEEVGGKVHVRAANGWCVFFADACLVHPAKPSVCRAWPFFQGNMLDELSWRMAQGACPGINPAAGHDQFVREGLEYLREMGLVWTDKGPNALNLERCKAPFQCPSNVLPM